MIILSIIIFILTSIDILLVTILSFKLRREGNAQYLTPTFHKLCFFILLLIIGFFMTRNLVSFDSRMIYAFLTSFVIIKLLEFDDYFINVQDPRKINMEGMTDDGKKLLNEIINDMEKQPFRPIIDRTISMLKNFMRNLIHDLWVLTVIITNDKEMKENMRIFDEFIGTKGKFGKYNFFKLVNYSRSRFIIDISMLLLAYSFN